MENAKLSGWQLLTLSYCFVCATTFLLLPGKFIEHAKQFGWLVGIWSFIYGVLLAMIWLYLSRLYPGLSIVQIAIKSLGNGQEG